MSRVWLTLFGALAAAGGMAEAAQAQTKPPITAPVGNSYLAGTDPPTAQFLHTVAWETVQEYYGK